MKNILMATAILTMSLALCTQVQAVGCTFNGAANPNLWNNFDINATGTIVVNQSDPEFKVLKSITTDFPAVTPLFQASCLKGEAPFFYYGSLEFPVGSAGQPKSFFSTGVSGIYYALKVTSRVTTKALDGSNIKVSMIDDAYVHQRFSGFMAPLEENSLVDITPISATLEIVKGSTLVTPLPGTLRSIPALGYVTESNASPETHNFSNRIHLNSSLKIVEGAKCTFGASKDRFITLAKTSRVMFSGIGSTASAKPFDMSVICQTAPTAYESKIKVSYDFVPDSSNMTVLSNTADPTTKASGVGIQLLWDGAADKGPIKSNDIFTIGNNISTQGGTYMANMIAQYYQTESIMTPGLVTGMATVTIHQD
ncbi:fimbrial protein [Acinetobacter calcoaceticus]|uniref:Fimbrial protein n=1 Tax=Acinetobacter calcoaceticus TaxID=471 RepID=A0A4R1Y5E8_ACICA|nr:fimbrial protein [Acinetobacter calcoaceticus]